MKPCFRSAWISALFVLLLVVSKSVTAQGKHHNTPPRFSIAHQDGGRLDLIRDPEDLNNDSINFLGQIVGHYKYLIVRQPGKRAYIAAYYKGRHLFSVPDEDINDVASDSP